MVCGNWGDFNAFSILWLHVPLITFIEHLNSAIEGTTILFTCINIRHLIENKRL